MVLNLFVESPDTRSERRIEPHLTIAQLKDKLELVTGIPAPNQILSLLPSDGSGRVLAQLSDDNRTVESYGVHDLQVLKVDDSNPSNTFTGQLTDVSQVEKFEMSDEAYAQRRDTVLAYKQLHKVGRFAPQPEEDKSTPPTPEVDIPIGSRCEVESTEPGLSKRGTVRFVGPTKFGTGGGVWVGVEYDEPFGKNDGSIQGERYFTCRSPYGVFVRPEKVKIGDFPVDEINLDDDEEM